MNSIRTLWGEETLSHTKQCIKCRQVKSLSDFMTRENLKSGKSSYRTECKSCAKEKSNTRKLLEKTYPRPTNSDYKCPICDKTEVELKENDRWNDRSVWCLDHNHDTLEFRGWICNNCNIAIGRLNDSPEIALSAYRYLNR
jgi:Zn finger protein HypA/HybF involved in hydrogenase expression